MTETFEARIVDRDVFVDLTDQDFLAAEDRDERRKTDGRTGIAGGYVFYPRAGEASTRLLVEIMRVGLPTPYAELTGYQLEELGPGLYRRVTIPRVILRPLHCPYCFSDQVEATRYTLPLHETFDLFRLFACRVCRGSFASEKELDGTPVV